MSIQQGAGGSLAVPELFNRNRSATLAYLRQRTAPQRIKRWLGTIAQDATWTSWMVIDLAAVASGAWVGFRWFHHSLTEPHVGAWQAGSILCASLILSALINGLYDKDTIRSRGRIVMRACGTLTLAGVLSYAVIYVLMYTVLSRRVSACALLSFGAIGILFRLLANHALDAVRRTLISVGRTHFDEALVADSLQDHLRDYRILGYVDNKGTGSEPRRLGACNDLPELVERFDATDIVVSDEYARQTTNSQYLLACLRRGCRVTDETTFIEKASGQVPVGRIAPQWFLIADLKVHCERFAVIKRAFDLVVGSILLVVSLPFWLLIAMMIKFDDGGPVFYSQDRVGQNGVVFRLFKFRTMCVGAEKGKSVWAIVNDPRVTRFGRWLRKSRLDELPQLINVLTGRMSIVGPRPERPRFVVELAKEIPFYHERHLVKPGLTGWAQISFRYGASVHDSLQKLQYDLYYLKNMSLELDIIILLRTVGKFLHGAR
jgi:sugar transferase (PEP-CTERM system associated)